MVRFYSALSSVVCCAALSLQPAIAASQASDASAPQPPSPIAAVAPASPAASSKLAAGTPVIVMTNEELSTELNKVGDRFHVTVLHDVMDGPTVVIPKGTTGVGEVTFATGNGGFGKPGILSISLRHLELNGSKPLLDGRYREEGRNKNGATAATWFAVGVFSGFIRGKDGVIPKGRELKARTGEDIAFVAKAQPLAAANASQPINVADAKAPPPAVPAVSKE